MSKRGETASTVRWLTGITKPVHGPLAISTVCRILNLSLDIVLFALAAGGVVAVVLGQASAGAVVSWLVVVAMAKAAAYYLEQFTGHYVAFKALELLRNQMFGALLPQAPGIVAQAHSGDLLTSLTRDVDRIEVVYAHTFAPLVSAVVVPLSALCFVGFAWGWELVPIPLAAVLLSVLVVPWLGFGTSMRATERTLDQRRRLAHHVTDSVFGIEEVTTYGRSEERTAEAGALTQKIGATSRTPALWVGFRRAANLGLMVVTMTAFALVGVDAGLPTWVVAALVGGSLRLFEGPRGVEDAASYLDHSLAAARRLKAMSETPPLTESGKCELDLDAAPQIDFEDVSFGYAGGRQVLDGLRFTAQPGEHITLVGPSGGGKSTALRLLLRYYEPSGGRVLLNGKPIQDFTTASLREQIGVVPQRAALLNTTVRENLLLSGPNAGEDDLWAALATAHLDQEIAAMPLGLDTPVGEGGSELSGGQAQRLCLARALVSGPKLLVLDEFTANLNPELDRSIRDSLKKDLPNVTILEVAHTGAGAAAADHVIVVD